MNILSLKILQVRITIAKAINKLIRDNKQVGLPFPNHTLKCFNYSLPYFLYLES